MDGVVCSKFEVYIDGEILWGCNLFVVKCDEFIVLYMENLVCI